jgi:hypothetical protein
MLSNLNDIENKDVKFFRIRVIQSGEIININLDNTNLRTIFSEIYFPLLKKLRLKKEDAYLSNDQGKMVRDFDLKLSLEKIIERFGNRLNLYYEKVM